MSGIPTITEILLTRFPTGTILCCSRNDGGGGGGNRLPRRDGDDGGGENLLPRRRHGGDPLQYDQHREALFLSDQLRPSGSAIY